MATIPYVTQDDVAKSKLVTRAGYGQAWLATAWCATGIGLGLLAGAITVGESTAGVLAAAVITVLLGWRFVRRIGGLTGDFLGAAEQCAEVAFLLAVALVRGSGGA
jgi:adenosylcobinamide-GDP ribazoletransferase